MQDGDIVASLSAHSLRRRKNPNLFVIANSRRAKSNLFGDLRNTEPHGTMIDEAFALSSRSFLHDKKFTKFHLL